MRTSALFVVGLLASANASVLKERSGCSEDNCLRALRDPTRPGPSFCSAFLATSTHAIPTFASPCSSSIPRISSACNCALGTEPTSTSSCSADTITVTASIPGGSTTIIVPTTVTILGEEESTTVTVPTTVTLPGEDKTATVTVPTTVTVPGGNKTATVTVPTTVTVPGGNKTTTVTAPTTVTVPGGNKTTTVTITGPTVITTVTAPANCSSSSSSSASPSTPPAQETGIPKSVPPYTYLQCTNNGGANLALSEAPSTSDSQTPAACASTCSGFTYFGVTKGNTCYCGDTLNPKSNNPDDHACNIPCSGNSKQFCGGQAHIQIYKK